MAFPLLIPLAGAALSALGAGASGVAWNNERKKVNADHQQRMQDSPQPTFQNQTNTAQEPQFSQDDINAWYAQQEAAAAQSRQAAQAAAEEQRQKDYTVGLLNEQIGRYEGQLGSLDKAYNTGKSTIQDLYNKNVSRANSQASRALSGLATQRTDTQSDFNRMDEDVSRTARNQYQALQNMLSNAGAGSSSAADILAPYAVSNDASRTRGREAEQFGRVYRDISTKEEETNEDHKNILRDYGDQRKTSLGNLDRDTQVNRRNINDQIGSLKAQVTQAQGGNWQQALDRMKPHSNESAAIDTALATLADKYRNPYEVKDVQVREAQRHNYSVDPNGVVVDGGGRGNDTDTSAEYRRKIEEEEERKRNQQQGIYS